jgi:hypothetical protein
VAAVKLIDAMMKQHLARNRNKDREKAGEISISS